jgi:pimeloyl-ACP methyl ester carboxylesterase
MAGMMMVRIAHPRIYLAVKPLVKLYLRTFRLDIESDGAQYAKYSSALDSADPWKLRRAMLSLSRYEVWDKLADNNTPTLIIGGKRDLIHEPGNLQKMADILPNAMYVDMETNSRTHSAEVVDEIKGFLAKIVPGKGC